MTMRAGMHLLSVGGANTPGVASVPAGHGTRQRPVTTRASTPARVQEMAKPTMELPVARASSWRFQPLIHVMPRSTPTVQYASFMPTVAW